MSEENEFRFHNYENFFNFTKFTRNYACMIALSYPHKQTPMVPIESSVAHCLRKYYALDISRIQKIHVGIANSSFEVNSPQGKVFLKIIPKENTFSEELVFLEHLKKHDIPILLPLKNNRGEYITPLEEGSLLVYPFVEEAVDNIHDFRDDEKVDPMMAVMALIHQVPLTEGLPRQRLTTKRKKILQFGGVCSDKNLVDAIIGPYEEIRERIESQGMEECIIHGDLFPGNLIYKKKRVLYVIDTEDLEIDYRIQDICTTLIILISLRSEKLSELLPFIGKVVASYEHASPLSTEEKELLFLCFLSTCYWVVAWRYVDFNFLKRNPDQYDSYKMILGRIEELKNIGQRSFDERVFSSTNAYNI